MSAAGTDNFLDEDVTDDIGNEAKELSKWISTSQTGMSRHLPVSVIWGDGCTSPNSQKPT